MTCAWTQEHRRLGVYQFLYDVLIYPFMYIYYIELLLCNKQDWDTVLLLRFILIFLYLEYY
ncbi:hypothetical protein Sjap_012979 [Stephania japonica]|uniref:Uncharacterized protein n=1 Tax=Stephania japonica TaxID=461633 RepID=A0AAP0IZ14_9MAGN